MIPGIVASGVPQEESSPDIDPFFVDVLLLIDATKHSDAADPFWTDVVLLLDGSKQS